MKIAHLILAHTNAPQLERLIGRLEDEHAWFFIHLDLKTQIEAFRPLKDHKNVVFIEPRVSVAWGAYSIVQATINGFEAIVSTAIDFDMVNLMSGSDYPIKSREHIRDFFIKHPGKNFMHFELVHSQWQEAISRLTEYHLTDYNFPGKYKVQKWVNTLFPRRNMPEALIPVGRSQWFSVNLDAVKYILEYLRAKPSVTRFFRLTWAPDEIIFHTILYNSEFRESLVNDNLRYIVWPEGKASPKTLTKEDLPDLIASDALFARKFDLNSDPEIFNLLDRETEQVRKK